jgi:BMFP domain-containing protein YqiC
MQTDNRFLDDLAKVASGALGSVSGMRHEVEVRLQQQIERLLARMNLVPREEFDAMKAVAQAAREAQIRLEARVAALEAQQKAAADITAANLAEAPGQESEPGQP